MKEIEMSNDNEKLTFDGDAISRSMEEHLRKVSDSTEGITKIEYAPQKNTNMGDLANSGMTRDDSQTSTRLLEKNWSPLIVRKYQMEGWPMFISMITDANLNDLDTTVHEIMDEAKANNFVDGRIQGARNTCGLLSDRLKEHYDNIKKGCVEGIAVLWYIDKCFISSLYGDFMVHASCKQELFAIINTLPHI
jgi:hypothetical protein